MQMGQITTRTKSLAITWGGMPICFFDKSNFVVAFTIADDSGTTAGR